jgi:hypothetical protein
MGNMDSRHPGTADAGGSQHELQPGRGLRRPGGSVAAPVTLSVGTAHGLGSLPRRHVWVDALDPPRLRDGAPSGRRPASTSKSRRHAITSKEQL